MPPSIVLLFSLIVTATAKLTLSELKSLCPKEKEVCAGKAAKGDCFGSSLRAGVLQKECKCSCDAVHHERIQKCCRTVGDHDMKFCLPLCRYNTSTEETYPRFTMMNRCQICNTFSNNGVLFRDP